jgi:hypothetical protein
MMTFLLAAVNYMLFQTTPHGSQHAQRRRSA